MEPYPFLDDDTLEKYLNLEEVKEVLKIKDTDRYEKLKNSIYEDDFMTCSGYLWDNFASEFHKNFISKMIPAVHNFRVLV